MTKVIRFEIGSTTALVNPRYQKMLEEVFGIDPCDVQDLWNRDRTLRIECTPLEFCEFLVARNSNGFCNNWKDLYMEIHELDKCKKRDYLSTVESKSNPVWVTR